MAALLKIKSKVEEGSVIVTPEGRIDANTASLLDKEISSVIENTDSIVIDFDSVEYISSAGLRVILGTSKVMLKKNGDFKLINVSDNIMDVFAVTGFINKLNIVKK
jgi:anti-sigma B factor antagonist